MGRRSFSCVLLCALTALSTLAFAQTSGEPQTRAEQLRREREQKQREAQPYQPNALERAMMAGEGGIVPLLQRDGIYAKLGSLTTGSGLAYGAGFRDRTLIHGRGSLDVWAAASLKKYWSLEARASYPLVDPDRVSIEGYARRFGYPQEEFFGMGPDSRRQDQTAFNHHGWYAGGLLNVRTPSPLSFGGGLEYLQSTIGRGRSGSLRSIENVFDVVTAPGIFRDHEYVRALTHLTYDYRQPLNARKGGLYRLDLSRYVDRTGSDVGFTRLDLDLRQFVSFLAERRVLAGRMRVSTTDADDAGDVPFYLLPSLGGNDTLRGFRAHRFRGPHAILLQGEYRWEIWSGFEGALFVDAGKVAVRRADLDFQNLERDFGFGFRFNTDNGVIMRVDAAFGSRDGKHLHVVFGGVF